MYQAQRQKQIMSDLEYAMKLQEEENNAAQQRQAQQQIRQQSSQELDDDNIPAAASSANDTTSLSGWVMIIITGRQNAIMMNYSFKGVHFSVRIAISVGLIGRVM